MALNAGEMRDVIRIEQRSTTQDAAGEPANTWTEFVTRRAAVEVVPGSEKWTSEQRQGRVPTVFRLRYVPGVLPAMRVIFARDGVDKVFNILSAINPDGMRVEMVITAEELVEATP